MAGRESKYVCPGCGETFIRLGSHLPKCPDRDSVAPVERLNGSRGGR